MAIPNHDTSKIMAELFIRDMKPIWPHLTKRETGMIYRMKVDWAVHRRFMDSLVKTPRIPNLSITLRRG